MLTKEKLYNLYWNKELSQQEIAKMLGYHRLTIYRKMKKYDIKRRSIHKAIELQNRCYIFPNLKICQELAYILGVLIGDGSTYKRTLKNKNGSRNGHNYSIQLGIHKRDLPFAESFKKALEKIGLRPKLYCYDNIANMSGLAFVIAQSKVFYNWFKNLSLHEIENLLDKDKRYMISFIKGYYESDGTYARGSKGKVNQACTIEFSDGSKEKLSLAQKLLKKLDFKFKLYECNPNRRQQKIYYKLTLTGNAANNPMSRANRITPFLKMVNPVIKNSLRPKGYSNADKN